MDPLAGAYKKLLQDGVDAGTTKQADINGIFDLTALNSVTAETGGRQGQRRRPRQGLTKSTTQATPPAPST